MEDQFDGWFEEFTDAVRELGYTGPIDRDSARMDYDEGKYYDQAAKEFVDEMDAD